MTEARERAIVEMDVRRFAAHGAKALLIDAETVVLARDFHAARQEIAHRLVCAAVAELQFPRRGTECKREQLVAEANAEGRNLARDFAKRPDDGFDNRWVAGAVGDEEAVRLEGANFGRGCGVRQEVNVAIAFDEVAVDVPLRAAIDRDDLETRSCRATCGGRLRFDEKAAARRPFAEGFFESTAAARRDLRREICAGHRGDCAGAGDEFNVACRRQWHGGNDAAHRAAHAEATHERARINAMNRWNAGLFEPVGERAHRALIRRDLREFADNKARDARPRALNIFGGDAVIPHFGRGHGEDLPGVGEIRQCLLVAAHGGVEDDFACPFQSIPLMANTIDLAE